MNTTKEENAALIASFEAILADIEGALKRTEGVIVGEPFVIKMAPGLFLVRDGDKYRGGTILKACCYSPERAPAAAQHVREHSAGVFPDSTPVLRRDALREEAAAMRDLIARMKTLQSA